MRFLKFSFYLIASFSFLLLFGGSNSSIAQVQPIANTNWSLYIDSSNLYWGDLQISSNNLFITNSTNNGLLGVFQQSRDTIQIWDSDPAGVCGILIGDYLVRIQNDTLNIDPITDLCSVRHSYFSNRYGVRIVSKINERIIYQELTIYPNPNSGVIQIKGDKKFIGSSLLLRDLQGRLLMEGIIEKEDQNFDYKAPKGLYFLEITTLQGEKISKKVIKLN